MDVFKEDLNVCAKNIPHNFYNKSVLVTGSTGLIGSILIKSILTANSSFNANITVLALIRDENKAKNVFSEYLDNKTLLFIKQDVTEKLDVSEKVNYIIHAASQTASKEMVNFPVETAKTSVIGTLNILDFAVDHKVDGVVYLSSMEAFGSCNNESKRLSEEELGYIDLSNIRSCYPEGKRMCELLCSCYASEYDLNVKVARLSQVFGAGIFKTENRVFAQFARSAIKGEDIILHTDGTSWGNYCYTTDAINGIFTILHTGKKGQTYTVVNENTSIQIKDFARLIIEVSGNSSSKLRFNIPKDNTVYGYAPKTVMKLSSKKLRDLGWFPSVDLREMLERLFEYIKTQN